MKFSTQSSRFFLFQFTGFISCELAGLWSESPLGNIHHIHMALSNVSILQFKSYVPFGRYSKTFLFPPLEVKSKWSILAPYIVTNHSQFLFSFFYFFIFWLRKSLWTNLWASSDEISASTFAYYGFTLTYLIQYRFTFEPISDLCKGKCKGKYKNSEPKNAKQGYSFIHSFLLPLLYGLVLLVQLLSVIDIHRVWYHSDTKLNNWYPISPLFSMGYNFIPLLINWFRRLYILVLANKKILVSNCSLCIGALCDNKYDKACTFKSWIIMIVKEKRFYGFHFHITLKFVILKCV